MATLLDEELELDPALQDWQLMAPDAPISSALQPPEPRKALDVSRGAPSGLTRPTDAEQPRQPQQDTGGIDALKEAMAQARQNRLGAELGMAGETIAQAFVPQQQSSGFWQRQLEGADRPVQELQAFQKQRGEEEKLGLAAEGKRLYGQQIEAQVEKLRQQAEEAQAKRDPAHPSQVAGRERFKAMFPEVAAAMGPAYDTATLDELGDYEKLRGKAAGAAQPKPSEMLAAERFEYQKRQDEEKRKQAAIERAERKRDKEEDRSARSDERAIERETRTNQQLATAGEKRKADVTQVETFGQNILRNLDRLEQKVGQTGTFSATGPDSKIMGALIKEIAVDSAKLADPGSVAREGEVAMEQSKLWDPGSVRSSLSLTNETAKQLLQDYRRRVTDRLQTAYDVRGLGARTGSTTPLPAAAPAGGGAPAAATSGGAVMMEFPGGILRPVAPEKMEAALRKGAKRASP